MALNYAPGFDAGISLQKLEILCLVVELGLVTRAAEQLHVAQPVVTAHLRSLEHRLGVKLFARSGRTLALTAEGTRVHAWASDTLQRAATLALELDSLKAGNSGSAAVGASMSIGSYLLPPILAGFQRSRPEAQVRLAIGDHETALRGVEQRELDFCVVISDKVPDPNVLEGELLGVEDIVLVTAADGEPLAGAIDLADLGGIPIVASPRGSVRRSLVDDALARLHAPVYRAVIEFGHPEAMKRAVLGGLGAAFLFRSSVDDELLRGALREVRFRDADLSVPIYAVKRTDRKLSELQERLLDAVRSGLQARLGPDAAAAAEDGIELRDGGGAP
jgi:DNA-binding transcriptional LysR family regulator